MRNNNFQDGVSNIGAQVVEWGLNTVGGVGRQYLPSPTPPTPPSSYKLADVKTTDKPLLFFQKSSPKIGGAAYLRLSIECSTHVLVVMQKSMEKLC